MQVEVRGRIAHEMTVILGIMPPQEGENPLAFHAIDIFDVVRSGDIAHDHDRVLKPLAVEGCGLPQKPVYLGHVVLREHRRDGIMLGRELKELEILPPGERVHIRFGVIYVGELIYVRVGDHPEVDEGEGLGEIQLGLIVRIYGGSIDLRRDDVHLPSVCGQSYVQRLRCRAHGEEESARKHVIPYRQCNRPLMFRHRAESRLMCRLFEKPYPLLIPCRVMICAVEFAVLSCEILMVQVEPVEPIRGQVSPQHLLVPYLRERDIGVSQGEFNGIVPRITIWRVLRRCIDGYPGRLFKENGIHILILHLFFDPIELSLADRLEGDAHQDSPAPDIRPILYQEGAAAVVEQPFGMVSPRFLQRPICQSIGLQVVGLRIIHRYEQPPCRCS